MRTVIGFFVLAFLSVCAHGGQFPVNVFIQDGYGTGFEPTPANPQGTVPGWGYGSMIPGKDYIVGVASGSTVTFTPPEGYSVYIYGQKRNSYYYPMQYYDGEPVYSPGRSLTVRIAGPAESFSGRAGTCSSLKPGSLFWQMSIGGSSSGKPLPPLTITSNSQSNDWSEIFTPRSVFPGVSPDMGMDWALWNCWSWGQSHPPHYNYYTFNRFGTDEVFGRIVPLSSTSFEVRLYERAQGLAWYQSTTAEPTGDPFVTYRIEKGATNTSLIITRETRQKSSTLDGAAPVVLIEQTSIEKSGSWPNCSWVVKDWNEVGATQLVEETMTSSGTPAFFTETYVKRVPGGAIAEVSSLAYQEFWWGHSLVERASGTDPSNKTSIQYYTEGPNPGLVKSRVFPGGNWEAFTYSLEHAPHLPAVDYAAGVPPTIGRVKLRTRHSPFDGLPANPPSDIAANIQGDIITYTNLWRMPWDRPDFERKIGGVIAERRSRQDAYYSSHNSAGPTQRYFNWQDGSSYVDERVERDRIDEGKPIAVASSDGTAEWSADIRGAWDGATGSFTPVDGTMNNEVATHSISVLVKGSSSGLDGPRISDVTDSGLLTPSSSKYAYSQGWADTSWPWNAADAIVNVYLVANKSTMTSTIRDTTSRVIRTEQAIWDGSQWQRASFEDYFYDFSCNLVRREKSNGEIWEASYIGIRKQWEKGADGTYISYSYDVAGRIKTVTKNSVGSMPAIVTSFTYDAAGNVLSERTGPSTGEAIVINRLYDDAGRLTHEGNAALAPSLFTYSPSTRTRTTTLPTGGTRVETRSLAGELSSVTGTSLIPEYYSYGTESDGRRWTRTDLGSANSLRWSKQWIDWLGRVVRTERPGPPGHGSFVEERFYDSTSGKLVKTTVSSGQAPTLYTYGAMGMSSTTGLDVDNNGTLESTSMDRITGTDHYFFNNGTGWWTANRTYTYPKANNDSVVDISNVYTRISGYSGSNRAETHSYDIEGRWCVTVLQLDRENATASLFTSTLGAGVTVDVSVNGLPVEKENAEGHVFLAVYDSLGRPSQNIDPRTGTTTTTYIPGTTLPYEVTDPSQNRLALFSYDLAGRVVGKTDALGKVTRTAYNLRNQPTAQWGEATSPVSFDYTSFGEQWKLHTYQAEANWNSITWPGGTPASTTTFTYDVATGLLLSKADAANQSVLHTYNAAGKTSRRSWARTLASDPTQRVYADYTYDSATGEQLSVSYNDGTPSVASSYDRTGKVSAISDATGTTTVNADPAKPWRTQSQTLGSLYEGRTLTTQYYESGWVGLPRGFTLAHPQSGQELNQLWGVTGTGRFETVASAGSGMTGRTFRYVYAANSSLVQSISIDGAHPFTQTKTYEAGRDLLTAIEAKWGASTSTRFDYTYNTRREPSSRKQAGYAYADYGDSSFDRYGYNDRGELTASIAYLGSNVQDLSQPLPGRREEFAYDAAGNRKTSGRTGVAGNDDGYSVNALNQYLSRENNSLPVWGIANQSASVQVSGSSQLAGRRGAFWSDELIVDNENKPFIGQINAWITLGGVTNTQTWTALLAPSLESFSYDADGNLLSDGFWDYQWDAENRLVRMGTTVSARIAGVPYRILEFKYDYSGRRVQKRVYNGDNSQTVLYRRYLYDGWALISEYDVNVSTGGLTLTRSYTWGLDLSGTLQGAGGIGGLLQIQDHGLGKALLPSYDGNGNVAALLNAATGALEAAYEYSPYGELRRAEGSYATANPFRFSTKFTDEESSLIYYGYRYYSARNGRFINRDPIEESGGLNLYGFVGNSPAGRWDYLGMKNGTEESSGLTEEEKAAREAAKAQAKAGDGEKFYDERGHVICSATVTAENGSTVTYQADLGAASNYFSAPNSESILSERTSSRYTADGIGFSTREQILDYYEHKYTGTSPGIGLTPLDRLKNFPAILAANQSTWWATSSTFDKVMEFAFLGKGKAAKPSGTPLYRAVMPGELISIQSRQTFSNPMGVEVKYFSTSAEGAAHYARQAANAFGDGPFTIVRTEMPTNLITPQMRVTVDRGVQSVVVPTEALPLLAPPVVLPATPLPLAPGVLIER